MIERSCARRGEKMGVKRRKNRSREKTRISGRKERGRKN